MAPADKGSRLVRGDPSESLVLLPARPKHPDRDLPDPKSEPTVTVDRAARVLGISRSLAFRAIESREIPSIRIGRRVLVPTRPLLRLIDGESPAPSAEVKQ